MLKDCSVYFIFIIFSFFLLYPNFRGNLCDDKLLHDFMSGEDIMNKEVISRTSSETFDKLEEKIYKVDSTGASISTGCSISLLHRYCAKLPRDM